MSRYLVFLSGLIMVSVVYLILSIGPIDTKPGSLDALAQGTNNTISMNANLKPKENQLLPDDRGYTVSSFQFNKSGAEGMCPRNNCEYDIENGTYRTSLAAGEYVFDGRLKVTITEDNTNKSEYYDMYANLRKVGSEIFLLHQDIPWLLIPWSIRFDNYNFYMFYLF